MSIGTATRIGIVGVMVALGAVAVRAESAAPETKTAKIETATDLLDTLEFSDATLVSFQSNVVYDKRFSLQDDRHIRRGRLYFQTEPAEGDQRPRRKFAVSFDTLQLDDVIRPEQQALIFDGEWLVEKREAEKQWVARQMAPPGSRIDPLRLGEGPLPIPFGQARAEIMARFDVELVDAAVGIEWEELDADLYRESVSGCWQLVLTPKAGTPDAERFHEIRLWYARDASGRILPRMAFTVDRKGDQAFVQLIGAKVNVPLPDGVIDMTEPDITEGWMNQREYWRVEDGEAAAE